MPDILIIGSTGQVGVELVKALSPDADFLALSRNQIDLANEERLRAAIRKAAPRFIVNAAAYTAVDRAESEPEAATQVNAVAPGIMAEEALRLGAWLLHFSTDYVFDGSGGVAWQETDTPNPLNVYGATKLAGERAIAQTGCRHLIFRTSWVYASHGQNFLRTMLRLGRERRELKVVDDQIGSPTSAKELAGAIRKVLVRLQPLEEPNMEPGIYHVTCRGATSWFGFAKAIFAGFEDMFPAPKLIPIPSEQFPTPAIRPLNSVLDCGKLERTTNIRLVHWQDALAQVAGEIREQIQRTNDE
jgi:dTDP-4-dehydrorhamnose reductase